MSDEWWKNDPVVQTTSGADDWWKNDAVAQPKRGIGAALYDNLIGSDDGVNSVGEKIGTLLGMGGESMTLGLVGDEASAAASGMLPGSEMPPPWN